MKKLILLLIITMLSISIYSQNDTIKTTLKFTKEQKALRKKHRVEKVAMNKRHKKERDSLNLVCEKELLSTMTDEQWLERKSWSPSNQLGLSQLPRYWHTLQPHDQDVARGI